MAAVFQCEKGACVVCVGRSPKWPPLSTLFSNSYYNTDTDTPAATSKRWQTPQNAIKMQKHLLTLMTLSRWRQAQRREWMIKKKQLAKKRWKGCERQFLVRRLAHCSLLWLKLREVNVKWENVFWLALREKVRSLRAFTWPRHSSPFIFPPPPLLLLLLLLVLYLLTFRELLPVPVLLRNR